MTNPLPGSAKRAGYVERRSSQRDYFRLLIAPPRDEDVLVADEIVYYKAPKHAMSLLEPLIETAAVLVVVVSVLLRPNFTGLDLGLLLLVLSGIVVFRWVRDRDWGWGAVFSGVIAGYFFLTTSIDPLLVVTGVGLFFIARFGLCALRWYSYEMRYLTNRRIIEATGFLGLRVASMPVTRITDLVLTRTSAGEVFGYGALRIESAGQDQSLANVPFLTHPKLFHRLAVRLATTPAEIDITDFIEIRPSRQVPR